MNALETKLVSPSAAPLPPQVTAGKIIGRTFRVWTENVVAFSVVVLVAQLPVLALRLWVGPIPQVVLRGRGPFFRSLGVFYGMGLVSWILGTVSMGALTYGVLQALDGRRQSAGALLEFGLRRFWPVFVTSLNAWIRIVLWSFLLAIPGILAIFRLFVAVPAQVAEPQLRSNAAVARSRELTKGRRNAIFLAVIVFWLAAAGINGFVTILGLQRGMMPFAMATIIMWVVHAVASGLFPTAAGVVYHDLRLEKEGVDTAQLVAVFE